MANASGIFGILTVQVGGNRDEHPLTKPVLNIGRSSENDLILLDDPQISRHHLRLTYTAQGFQVQDLGSAVGALLNGQPLAARQTYPIGFDQVVQLASFQLSVRPPAAPVPPSLGDKIRISARPLPGLAVYAAGQMQKFPLDKAVVSLGRASDNDIVISATVISGHHARLQQIGSTFTISDLGSSNGLTFDGQRVPQKALLDGDVLYVTDQVAIQYRSAIGLMGGAAKAEATTPPPVQVVGLPTDDQPVRIGRAKDNQIVLDHPQVSRYHAMIERMGVGRYRIHDLKSANGVFVGNKRIERESWLKDDDEIQIGPFRLDLKQGNIRQMEDRGMRLDVLHLQKWVSKEKNLLQDISLAIAPQEFVALVGLSGAGKSTLMNALTGFNPATHGAVFVNDIDLYKNFDLFRNELGYVPQKDIVHAELSVYAALDYVAQLRMPPDTTPDERHKRILEVLEDLDLTERKDLPIHKLSGGQLKRVSIGVELLTKPRLFYLDEPTSGLDPGTEYNMMKLLRHLADQGRTIVLITHATKNVMMCDKVIFVVRGGYVAFYGPPEEALIYFDRFRTDQERREKDMEFDSIYIVLEDDKRGKPTDWADRYQKSPAYQNYVVERLRNRRAAAANVGPDTIARRVSSGATKRVNALRQLAILSSRNLNILMRDRLSLALMLLLAPGIGLMDFMWGRDLFDPVKGDPGKIITMLFMMGLITILVGALSSVLQIVKETDIYKRERTVGLQVGPYILSKVWIGLILALYQALVFLVFELIFVHPDLPGTGAYVAVYITLFIGTLSGYLFGLAISAAAPNLNVALLLVIVVLVPQFLFAGALLPLDLIPGGEQISVIASTRWAFEALVNITEFGKPLVDDPCWADRPKYDEDGETGWNTVLNRSDEEKLALGCTCMGATIFETCSAFPGIQSADFYDDKARTQLAAVEPQKPVSPTPYPSPTPVWSPTPYPSPTPLPQPSDPSKLDAYMDDSREQGRKYQDRRQVQGDEYQAQREAQGNEYQDARQQQGDEYAAAMETWGDQKADWERERQRAVKGAEGMLKNIFDNYGRAFKGTVASRWLAMTIVMIVLVGLIVFFQRQKDVV
ncbi:FHA domain-containing protein [Candidatus Amarolinea dominans]|uniref:FHA domain-containing protein n=1 Tax=Candidatus Amarolinea dominans TaxID=3140696 RepID=UPI003135B00B|nr:FHA domain-containing protein [Anaerolineae bacterium]MBK9095435.1 FHA domain-containing protein [Anaerolineae bacterium]